MQLDVKMMKIKVMSDQQILEEGFQVLMTHLGPSKAMRFGAACKLGNGDYLQLKDKLFGDETADSLYEKIIAYQNSKQSDKKEELGEK
ncbi:MAG: hypothetical protein AB4352_09760 [Hormoscilla sp.]